MNKDTEDEIAVLSKTQSRWNKRDKKSRPKMRVSGRGMKTLAKQLGEKINTK